MKHLRVIVTHYGGPEALQVIQEECPEPKTGEVRLRVVGRGCFVARCNGSRGHSSRDTPCALHAGVGPGWCRGSAW